MTARTRSLRSEQGFTLAELLVVILVIGILASIAISSFLSQKGKADDAGAKTLAGTAMTAMAVYATEHGGSYAGVSGPNDLAAIESSINVSDPNRPQLTVASGTDSGFTVTALAPVSGDTYTIASRHGVLAHTCAAGTGPWSPGGCAGGTW